LLKSEFSIITDREDAYIKAVFELIIECKQAERFLNYYSRGNFCLLEKVKDKINEIITSQMNPFYFMRLNSPQQNFTLVKDETIFKGDKLYLFLEQGIKLLLTYELHRLCEIVFYNLAKKNSVIFQNILKTLIDCKSIGQSWFDISENCLSDTKNLNKYLQHFFSPEHQKLLVNFLEKIQTSFNRDLFLAP
jgi:hypothetical protein